MVVFYIQIGIYVKMKKKYMENVRKTDVGGRVEGEASRKKQGVRRKTGRKV